MPGSYASPRNCWAATCQTLMQCYCIQIILPAVKLCYNSTNLIQKVIIGKKTIHSYGLMIEDVRISVSGVRIAKLNVFLKPFLGENLRSKRNLWTEYHYTKRWVVMKKRWWIREWVISGFSMIYDKLHW